MWDKKAKVLLFNSSWKWELIKERTQTAAVKEKQNDDDFFINASATLLSYHKNKFFFSLSLSFLKLHI